MTDKVHEVRPPTPAPQTAMVRSPAPATPIARPLEFSPEQRQMIRDTYANGATDEEFKMLIEIAKQRNLNPLLKQIYFVKRWDRQKGREVWSSQISIDGLRAVAQRTGFYDGQDAPEWEYADAGKGKLLRCTVRVYRKDWSRPAIGISYWAEAAQTNKSGELTEFWRRMPHAMLAKTAETAALRKAFSEETGGMGVDGVIEPDPTDEEEVSDAHSAASTASPVQSVHASPPKRVVEATVVPDDPEPGPARSAPSAPDDFPLPFSDGRWAGKRLSDIQTEQDFRYFIHGYLDASRRADIDPKMRQEKLLWADRVSVWAKFRGITVE